MSLLRSAATVGGYTMVSRVLGFIREILTAAHLGAGPLSDAFFVALRLPNLFRSLFAEGAFAQAFVPIFSGTLAKDGRAPALIFARDTFLILLLTLCLFLAAAEFFAAPILHVVAPGFERDPAEFRLVVALTRITFPYLLFISLVSFLGGMLNAVERFAANAASAALLNVFLILTLLFSRPPHRPCPGLGGHPVRLRPVPLARLVLLARRSALAAAPSQYSRVRSRRCCG